MVERFIAINVREFLKMRKRRLDGKVLTLKEFLVKVYKEMVKLHPECTKRRFPHITYGYSKRLKGKAEKNWVMLDLNLFVKIFKFIFINS